MAYIVPRIIVRTAPLPPEPKGPWRMRRVAIWVMIGTCGLMMSLVLVSQPEVAARIAQKTEHLSARFNGEAKDPVPVLNFSPDAGTSTSSAFSSSAKRAFNRTRGFMPKDSVPVRRFGIMPGG